MASIIPDRQLFIVTSALNTGMGVITPQDRIDQTIRGLEILRKVVPDAIIVFAEGSPNKVEEEKFLQISQYVDFIADFSSVECEREVAELFDSKRLLYKNKHNLEIYGIPVELYVQDSNQPHYSLGEYSLLKNEWIKYPKKRKANFDQIATKLKYEKLGEMIEFASSN